MTLNKIIKKIKYPQPHNIKIYPLTLCPEREIERLHGRLKYEAKYKNSKQSKRNYDGD